MPLNGPIHVLAGAWHFFFTQHDLPWSLTLGRPGRWGDEDYEYEAETYDLLTQASGVPVTGKGSLWPRRGRPVNSLWHSSDGPVSAKGVRCPIPSNSALRHRFSPAQP